jgi:glutaredoxin
MKFTVYGKNNCKFCVSAKQLIKQSGHEYEELSVPEQVSRDDIQLYVNESGSDHVVKSVPQIFHEGVYVGGFKELVEYLRAI